MLTTRRAQRAEFLSKQALADGAMAQFTALVATRFVVGGLITRKIEPEALTFLRFLIAMAIFLVPVAAHGNLALPSPRRWLRHGTIGFLLAVFVTLYEGLIGHGWPDFPVLIGIAVTAAAVAVIETGR